MYIQKYKNPINSYIHSQVYMYIYTYIFTQQAYNKFRAFRKKI